MRSFATIGYGGLDFAFGVLAAPESGSRYSRMDQINLRKTAFKKFEFSKAVFHKFYLAHS